MSNLRSSGQIEQDADFILLLFREDQKKVDCDRIITVAKNKTGVAGDSFFLKFRGETQTFSPSRREYKQPKDEQPKDEQPEDKLHEMEQMEFQRIPDDTPVPF